MRTAIAENSRTAVDDRVSAVIVSHNTADSLRECLSSLDQWGGPALFEIIVVDNASSDGTVELLRREFPGVRVLVNDENLGYGAAANQGVAAAASEYVLILNSDARVQRETIDALMGSVFTGDADIAGPRLLNEDGTDQRTGSPFPTPRVLLLQQLGLTRFLPGAAQRARGGRTIATDWVSGACLLARRDVLLRFGPFDRRFFMYAEDIDLCYRVRQQGMDVSVVPGATMVHTGQASSRRYALQMAAMSMESMCLFYRAHYSQRDFALCLAIFRATSAAKWLRDSGRLLLARAGLDGAADEARLREDVLQWTHLVHAPMPAWSADDPRAAYKHWPDAAAATPSPRDTAALTEPPSAANEEQPGDGASSTHRAEAETPSAASGSLALLIGFVVVAIINYAFAIVMSWLLPIEAYGRVGVIQSTLLLGSTLVSSGFPWALTKILSRRPSGAAAVESFRGALLANTALGVGIAALLYGATVSGLLPLEPVYDVLMLLAGATIVALAIGNVFSAALTAYLRLHVVAIARGAEVLLKVAVGVALVLAGMGAVGAVAGIFLGVVGSTLLAGLLLKEIPAWGRRGWTAARIDTSVIPFFLGMSGLAALMNLDIVGLKLLAPPDISEQLAGHYQAAVTLARIPLYLVQALFSAVFPYVVQYEEGRRSNIHAQLALKYTLLFIVPIDIVLAVAPDSSIRLFFSSVYDVSARPMALASVGTILITIAYGLAMLLQASGRLRTTSTILPAAAIIQIVSLVWLVPRFGMDGAATSLIVPGVFLLIALCPVAIQTYEIMPSLRQVALYALTLVALTAPFFAFPTIGRPQTFVTMVVAGFAYVLMLALTGLVTHVDVDIVANGLGPRQPRFVGMLRGLVGRLNLAARLGP